MDLKETKIEIQRPSRFESNRSIASLVIDAVEVYLPYLLLSLIIVFVLIVRMNLIGIPFERDEGIYNYFGQLVLDGKTPYLDFYELKPPGIYYAYALLNLIFGSSLERSHFAFMILNVLTILLLFLTGKKLLNSLSGAIVAVGYGILSLTPNASGFTSQAEHLVALFASGGMLALASFFDSRRALLILVSGLLFGLSMSIKQTGLFFVLFAGLSIVCYHLLNKPIDLNRLAKHVALYGLGVLSIVFLSILIVAAQGAFREFLYWTYTFPRYYVSDVSLSQGMTNLKYFFLKIIRDYLYLWLFAGIGLILGSASKLEGYKKAFIWLLAIFSFCTIWPGLRFYPHYWIQLLPGLSILIGVAFDSIRQLTRRLTERLNPTYATLALFLICISPIFIHEREYYFKPNYTKILREVYYINPFPESKVIGDYIKERTTKQDQVALIGSEPEIYYYANRRAPSKHAYFSYLVKDDPRSPELQREFIADLENAKPKFLVYFKNPYSLLVYPKADLTIFTWANRFVAQYYKLVGFADMIDLYNTKYVWGDAAANHKPEGKYFIAIFERKSSFNLPGIIKRPSE